MLKECRKDTTLWRTPFGFPQCHLNIASHARTHTHTVLPVSVLLDFLPSSPSLCDLPGSLSLTELVHVPVQPVIGLETSLVQLAALRAALAGLDHHHVAVESLSVLTDEARAHRAGPLRRAAAAIHTGAAVVGLEAARAFAPCVGQVQRLLGFTGASALLPFLQRERERGGCRVSSAMLLTSLL